MTVPGTTIAGRYRVLRRLGAGGMGSVWLATDTSLGRDVAVKSVLASVGADGSPGGAGEQRAMREARLIARINHPHAVAIYDVVWHEDQPWLVMEYVPSRNLSETVRDDGPLDPRRASGLGVEVASALADAHRAGIVHRDVKPANVLISEHGAAKITDFGIARGHDDVTLTATGALWGTPAYFAPEVARGGSPTEKADVWSLGATLYFTVEGAPPYGSDASPLVLLGRIAHQPVPTPRHAGPLTPVLARLLDRDPDSRPTMAEAAELLRMRAPDGEPTRPVPAPRVVPEEVPGHRRTGVLLTLVTILALAGVAALGLALLFPDGDGQTVAGQTPRSAPAKPSPAPTTPSDPDEGSSPRRSSGGRERKPDGAGNRSGERGRTFTAAAMEHTVAEYYALMPADTRKGFTLLGPSLRSQGFGSYDRFWDSIESVSVSNLDADPASRSVRATVVFVTKDGRTSTEQHEFGLVPDGTGEGLLIDTDTVVG
ncbi:MAG: serine/threonine protein kinase [Actinomycetota bacterium]|nr:serine/threonine protein kinase [Actinomycetota bacterium]